MDELPEASHSFLENSIFLVDLCNEIKTLQLTFNRKQVENFYTLMKNLKSRAYAEFVSSVKIYEIFKVENMVSKYSADKSLFTIDPDLR